MFNFAGVSQHKYLLKFSLRNTRIKLFSVSLFTLNWYKPFFLILYDKSTNPGDVFISFALEEFCKAKKHFYMLFFNSQEKKVIDSEKSYSEECSEPNLTSKTMLFMIKANRFL